MESSRIDFSFECLLSSQCDPRVSEPRRFVGLRLFLFQHAHSFPQVGQLDQHCGFRTARTGPSIDNWMAYRLN